MHFPHSESERDRFDLIPEGFSTREVPERNYQQFKVSSERQLPDLVENRIVHYVDTTHLKDPHNSRELRGHTGMHPRTWQSWSLMATFPMCILILW